MKYAFIIIFVFKNKNIWPLSDFKMHHHLLRIEIKDICRLKKHNEMYYHIINFIEKAERVHLTPFNWNVLRDKIRTENLR